MKYLNEGDGIEVQGSGKKPYIIKKTGGIVDCSCPAWRNFGGPIDSRTCKHIKSNIDPACLLPQSRVDSVIKDAVAVHQRLTKTGKVSTAVNAPVVKDTAPPVLLAHSWTDEDPTGWWMSEKLDGVRAWWDGKNFISRLGNTYHAPEWFKSAIPKGVVLDGELWSGRGKFQQTVGTVKKLIPNDDEWQEISFKVFDAPKILETFENRLQFLNKLFENEPNCDLEVWFVVSQLKCLGKQHLLDHLENVLASGAEGLMLRQPNSLYEEGRSTTLLKVKKFYDAEAKVIGHEPGRGKHKGRMGALLVEMDNGKQFKVGSGFTDKERESPPLVGSMITYSYQELTKDLIPRFPVFISTRNYE